MRAKKKKKKDLPYLFFNISRFDGFLVFFYTGKVKPTTRRLLRSDRRTNFQNIDI